MSLLKNTELLTAAQNLREAEREYKKAWGEIKRTDLLDADRFWEIFENFEKIVADRLRCHGDRKYVSREACDEFFRQGCVNEIQVSFDELVLFSNNWSEISAELNKSLCTVVETKSDDGFSDLCDSLPLTGRDTVAKLLYSDNLTHNNVYELVLESELCDLIWTGENYFGMFLQNQAKKWYVIRSKYEPQKKQSLV